MKEEKIFLVCPHCNVSVRDTNMDAHVEKVHGIKPKKPKEMKVTSSLELTRINNIDDERILYIIHKAGERDLHMAQLEYFGGEPNFKSIKQATAEMNKFVKWYNRKYKQLSGITAEDMQKNKKRKIEFLEHPIEQAYGLVYDAIKFFNRRNVKDDEKGIMLLKKALELDPENDEVLYILLDIAFSMEEYDIAAFFVERAISLGVQSSIPYTYKAHLLIFESKMNDIGKLREALNFAKRAYWYDEEDFNAVMTCAQLFYWLGDDEYSKYVKIAEEIDSRRTKKFMKKYWISERPRL